MRNILIAAAILAGLGTFMAQMADRIAPASATLARPAQGVAMAAQIGTRSVSIPRDARGHFTTDGQIEGQHIHFMIDTGASVIALNEKSAAQFGLHPTPGQYTAAVNTANGIIRAAPTRLAMVEIAGLVVRDVDALVLPDESLSENLLGLSFLSRLKRIEYANGQMVLEQ